MSRVLPMDLVFREAAAELDLQRMPVHYEVLTRRAVERLGELPSTLSWQRQIEDVREKMLEAGRYGTSYVGRPHCLAVKASWFSTNQLDLLNADSAVAIDVDFLAVVDGVVEGWQREQHMLKKARAASDVSRMRALFRGYAVESQVKPFFRAMWPAFYREPDNEGDLTAPCNHDFKLAIRGRTYEVDVFSPRLDGSYGRPKWKPKADLHLACDIESSCVVWRGVMTRAGFVENVHPLTSHSPLRMVVWLNTLHAGLPYDEIAAAVSLRGAA